ncbi:MAG: toprim domain-containing protein [Anaerolineae bacterium]|nr:toprim domain-containing protein [Anaerolineae bacterium]
MSNESRLQPHHLRMLRDESGITDEMIRARGYRSIKNDDELRGLGFAPGQCRVPGLLLPLYTTDGQNGLYVYRPDKPRVVEDRRKSKLPDGTYPQKVIKYEQPKGTAVRVDCPPICQPMLADPTIPLFLTEGQKKADALASRGACAIALTGVWNFKGKNDWGGTTLLADFDYIAFDGREVYIVYDSDVMSKTAVRQALARLTEHLQRKKATVAQVYLTAVAGRKVGVDDWFVAYPDKTIDDLKALAEGPRTEVKAAPPDVELLDEAPPMMTRPLALINGRSYVATWCYVQVTRRESEKNGKIIKHDPPLESQEQQLFIIRDDGVIFGEGLGDSSYKPLRDAGLIIKLAEIPQPDKLLSTRGLKAYWNGKRPNPTDIFYRVVAVINRFIDFDHSLGSQEIVAELVACYVLATWFLDAWTVAGNLWPNGDRGSGKTQLLIVACELAYLGQVILAGGSFAALRDLADYGATLGFDDAENLADHRKTDPDKRALLLAGNRRGNTIPLKEKDGRDGWKTRHVNTYCFRLFSAINLPDNVLASRTITLPLIRTPDRYRANADPLDYSLWPHDRRELIDDLWCLALAHLPEMKQYETAVNQQARLTGRNLEPWRALLAVALWLDEQGISGLWARMEQLSIDYQVERPNLELSDLTALTIRALGKAIVARLPQPCDMSDVCDMSDIKRIAGTGEFALLSSDITAYAHQVITEAELDLDTDKITARRIGRVLGKMRFASSRVAGKGTRGWRITLDELARWVTSYGLPLSEVLGFEERNVTNVTAVTNVTPEEDLTGGTI